MDFSVIIIGAGPAGLACASYLHRLGVGCAILFDTFGGKQNYYRNIYGLYPSTKLTTKKFLDDQIKSLAKIQRGTHNCQIETFNTTVDRIILNSTSKYCLQCCDGKLMKSEVVVIACGTDVNIPKIENLSLNQFYTFKDFPYNFVTQEDKVLLLGAGNTSSEIYSEIYARVSEILILDISNENFINLNPERKKVFKKLKRTIIAFDSNYKLNKNSVNYSHNGASRIFLFNHLILCTGEKANTQFLPKNILNNTTGKIIIYSDNSPKYINMSSHWVGLFAIGDVKDDLHTSNIAFAISDGMRTALSVFQFIKDKN